MILFFFFLPNLNSTLLPTRYCEHLFCCLKYFTVLLETSLFRFMTASLALIVFRSLSLMISLDGCKHGWTAGFLFFSIDFPHWSSLLDFARKYTSKAGLQPSSSLFLLLRHFLYFYKFFDQVIPACFFVIGSYVIFLFKDLCDRSAFPYDLRWYVLLFIISIFFTKIFDFAKKFISSITLKCPRVSVLIKNFLEFRFHTP